LQITEERKKQVIDLYFNQHKSYAEIAETIIAVSLRSKTNLSETFKHVLLIVIMLLLNGTLEQGSPIFQHSCKRIVCNYAK
jgi:hypothetical protein